MRMQNVIYPADCRAVIDVTKPPYNLDNTGKTDCTKKLVQIVDDVLRPHLEGIEITKKKLEAMPDPNAAISFEIRKVNGLLNVIFPEDLPESRIIYFPNGTYLVSDTISYTFENLVNIIRNTKANEMNRQIHFMGQSRDGVIIKLKDNCPGFGFGSNKPVISFMRGERSNIAMTNTFENITIDIGKGNPGAVGLVFFGNNTGAVRNVRIRSSDEDYRGSAGLEVIHEVVSGCYVKNLEVEGFDYGVRVTPLRNFTVFEHITLKNQRKTGFLITNTITSIRGLKSFNSVAGIRVTGQTAHVVLTDAEFYGGSPYETAMKFELGTFFIRNIKTSGYKKALAHCWCEIDTGNEIDEYCSHEVSALFEGQERKSLRLEVEETPDIPWEDDLSKWVSVNSFGAKGDGVSDDTLAIQKAMDSGYPVIYFQPGKYLVDGVIKIPPAVRRVNFMFCDLIAGENIKQKKEAGTFTITGDSETPLIMEDLFAWEKYHGYMRLINHASKRTLILSDLHVQTGAVYFNTVPGGRVFMENVCSTIGGEPYHEIPNFMFSGQKVWARHINPERSLHEVVNDGSTLWVLGFKTEGPGTAYDTRGGGSTEILGGTISIGGNEYPAIVNNESNVSVTAATNGYMKHQLFPVAVRERRNGECKELMHTQLPIRLLVFYHIPLYVGYRQRSLEEDGFNGFIQHK